ncbi:MAG TPA: RNA polymerase sigma factor [Patescibacteria group bacterium]|jgi:RNA polymerase sigma-70 factor (ECF subfamily)|nr:RNA polymerase sigma factor [Patescibacteria group bacterium]
MTDEELNNLLLKAQSGDRESFGLIYGLYSQKIYKFIYFRIGHHKEMAEDLLSDTFVKAWLKIEQINSPKALSSWLYQVAKNNIIDYYRLKKTTVNLEEVEDTLEDAVNPVDEANLGVEQKKILELIEQLSSEQAQVIRYKFFEDLTNPEIAHIMNKNEGAVRVIQHRAILKLKELFNKRNKKAL